MWDNSLTFRHYIFIFIGLFGTFILFVLWFLCFPMGSYWFAVYFYGYFRCYCFFGGVESPLLTGFLSLRIFTGWTSLIGSCKWVEKLEFSRVSNWNLFFLILTFQSCSITLNRMYVATKFVCYLYVTYVSIKNVILFGFPLLATLVSKVD